MQDDDDEEEDPSINVTKYACVPSLVALQQMRNRLHLANVGKKLMKWTARATGRELRLITAKLEEEYRKFAEDTKNAYMLLARGRFYQPNLNKMVIENCPLKASIRVTAANKSISGVKVIRIRVLDTGEDPYQHLCIEKGGQTITEAKKAWNELLKKMICILELRKGFHALDLAHKAANKRQMMLKKIVIPKIKATIVYIQFGLEEMAREDTYRLKMVKQNKQKMEEMKNKILAKYSEPSDYVSEVGIDNTELSTTTTVEPSTVKEESPDVIEEAPTNIVEEAPPNIVEELPLDIIEEVTPDIKEVSHDTIKIGNLDTAVCPSIKSDKSFEIPCATCKGKPTEHGMCPVCGETKLACLKQCLNEVIAQSKKFLEKGAQGIDIVQFLKACDDIKAQIEEFVSKGQQKVDDGFTEKLSLLKCNLQKVLNHPEKTAPKTSLRSVNIKDPTEEDKSFKKDTILKNTVKQDTTKKDTVKKTAIKQDTDTATSRLLHLRSVINDVIKTTHEYQKDGLLTTSAENFIQSCATVKFKIDEFISADQSNIDKIEYLTKSVTHLDKITDAVKQKGISSCVLEKFKLTCKSFKSRLDQYKKQQGSVAHLITHIDQTIDLSKRTGITSDSVEEFIQHCEEIKSKIQSKPISSRYKSEDEIKSNINEIVNKLNTYVEGKPVTESTENLIKFLDAQIKIENETDIDGCMIHPPCSMSCVCSKSQTSHTCGSCDQITEQGKCQLISNTKKSCVPTPIPSSEKFGTCKFNTNEQKCQLESDSEESIVTLIASIEKNDTCRKNKQKKCQLKSDSEESGLTINSSCCMSLKPPSPERSCSSNQRSPSSSCSSIAPCCSETTVRIEKKTSEADVCICSKEGESEGKASEKVAKEVQKIVKVTRIKDVDGTISEETETITITKELMDLDESEGCCNSKNKNSHVGLCIVDSQSGFDKHKIVSRSDYNFRAISMAEPNVRACFSDTDFRFLDGETESENDFIKDLKAKK